MSTYSQIPTDPAMLLSFINTMLRDEFSSFSDLCKSLVIDEKDIINQLKKINYTYDSEANQFI